jgi:hypothetical protein
MVSFVCPVSSPSVTSRTATAWGVTLVRLSVGPLAMAAFFMPWAHGPGPLAATQFTGFTLVGFAGRLQALDLSLVDGGILWFARLAILGVAVAAAWQIVLAPRHRYHAAYPASGWYIAALAATTLAIGALRSGVTLPPSGLALLGLAGFAFAVGEAVKLTTTLDVPSGHVRPATE